MKKLLASTLITISFIGICFGSALNCAFAYTMCDMDGSHCHESNQICDMDGTHCRTVC